MDELGCPTISHNGPDAPTTQYALEEQVRKTVLEGERAFRKCLADAEWFRQYNGQWVVLHGPTILGYGDSQKEVLQEFSRKYDANDLVVRRVRRQVLECYVTP